mmetsp:Transcript_9577/g.34183  ORF Transcript_9577/g.34183 Transcript_9577/m.34183 type:complete len:372 (-) Transcript_9577:548-1663(-)
MGSPGLGVRGLCRDRRNHHQSLWRTFAHPEVRGRPAPGVLPRPGALHGPALRVLRRNRGLRGLRPGGLVQRRSRVSGPPRVPKGPRPPRLPLRAAPDRPWRVVLLGAGANLPRQKREPVTDELVPCGPVCRGLSRPGRRVPAERPVFELLGERRGSTAGGPVPFLAALAGPLVARVPPLLRLLPRAHLSDLLLPKVPPGYGGGQEGEAQERRACGQPCAKSADSLQSGGLARGRVLAQGGEGFEVGRQGRKDLRLDVQGRPHPDEGLHHAGARDGELCRFGNVDFPAPDCPGAVWALRRIHQHGLWRIHCVGRHHRNRRGGMVCQVEGLRGRGDRKILPGRSPPGRTPVLLLPGHGLPRGWGVGYLLRGRL